MARSTRYRELRTNINQLRRYFLPSKFSPTGSYTERQFDRVSAFRLMVHAEIEWYLELVVFDTANKAYDNWINRHLVTEPLLAMVAYVDSHLGSVPTSLPQTSNRDLDSRIWKSLDWFNSYVRETRGNNGIRAQNILKLLLSVGVSEADIDPIWLTTTDDYGKLRGTVAHSSKQVYSAPDPREELNKVNKIIDGLLPFDEKLSRFRAI